jgi:LysR family transcriptional regulator, transcriptional activator of nhaA
VSPTAARSLNALNFQHLLYFWTVAREGSVTRATVALNLAQPTISGQIRALERSLGERLFERRGRGLALTEVGQMVFRYADEMFGLGRELQETLAGRASGERPARFAVGVSDSLPKLTTYRLLEPALAAPDAYRLLVRVGKTNALLAELETHTLDLVLADAPAPAGRGGAFSHLLGESGVSVFGTAPLTARHRRGFPKSLQGAPFLLHAPNTAIRRALDQWFADAAIHPRVVAEVEDVALLQEFGREGLGLFAAPTVVEARVRRAYDVRVAGRLPAVREHFYAISVERRLTHPAVLAIRDAARTNLFRA